MAAMDEVLPTSPQASGAVERHSSGSPAANIRTKMSTQPIIPSKTCVDVICCDADCMDSAPSSPCSDIHHISSACNEPSCGAASSSTATIVCPSAVACCDDTECIDVPGSSCSQSPCSATADCPSMTLAIPTIATCCDDEACVPKPSPRLKTTLLDTRNQESRSHKDRLNHIAPDQCRECRGSIAGTGPAEGGKLYSSFQELLDCCCCSMPPTVEQCCVAQSPHPCNAPHPSPAENSGHSAHDHHHHHSSHEATASAPPLDTPSSSVITNGTQQTSPDLRRLGSRASTVSTAATPQPVSASPLQWSTPFMNVSSPQYKSSFANNGFSAQRAFSLEEIFTELQSWNDCSFEQPHLHNSNGGCLPPAMTICDSDACPTIAPHSHWMPRMHQHAEYCTLPASSCVRPEDTRPQQCQWGGCNERFWTVEELVAHVNHSHLARKNADAVLTTNGRSVMQPVQTEADHLTPTVEQDSSASLECLWNDCHRVTMPDKLEYDAFTPTTEMDVLKASDASAGDKFSLAILQHLLHDHLGQHSAQPISLKRDHLPSTTSAVSHSEATSLDSTLLNKKRKHNEASSALRSSSEDSDELFCRWEGCSASFTSHSALTDHIETVHVGSGKASYECRWLGCARHASGQKFSQKQKVLRHIQTHTGDRPFKCTLCGKRFSEQNTLAQHMRTHTQERPYVCDYPGCGKAFSVAGSLTIHKRTHTGSKPFVCSYPGCGKAFAESSNLTKHMRTHTGDKPFVCEECGKGFSRPDQASRHRKTHERKRAKNGAIGVHEEMIAT